MIRSHRARQTLATGLALLLVLSAISLPAAAFPGLGLGGDDDTADDLEEFAVNGRLLPSAVVEVESGEMGALADWANSSDDRRLVDSAGQFPVVAAPLDQLQGGGVLDLGPDLVSRSYVEDVWLNYRVEGVDPIDSFPSVESYQPPELDTLDLLATGRLSEPEFSVRGIAFRNQTRQTNMSAHRDVIGADQVTETGDGVTVAVVDTGVVTAEGALFGEGSPSTVDRPTRVSNESYNAITNETVATPTGQPSNWSVIASSNTHGTWAASAAVADHSVDTWDGVAPDAQLLAVKALGDDGGGSAAQIARGIRYAADHDADVISLSLGSPVESGAIADAVRYAKDQGSLLVIAAGNSALVRSPGIATPADLPGVLTVGASNVSRNVSQTGRAWFSQFGPDPSTTDGAGLETVGAEVDILAPGAATNAMVPTSDSSDSNTTSPQTLSGTSMATPMASGVLALAEEQGGAYLDDPRDVRERVVDTARRTPWIAQSAAGGGMIAADRLLDNERTDDTQEEAQVTRAAVRDSYYRAVSTAQGRLTVELLEEI